MTSLIVVLGAVTALGAAARSTWSPCGLSMLSSITPFGERSRGHRYGATATWFILGSVLGGACLGGGAAAMAVAVRSSGLGAHPGALAAVGGVTAVLAAAVDAGLFGAVLPVVRRQVDDRWIAGYRPWVYASGFGWQIGVGVATYVMTAAVALTVVLAALTSSPWAAVLVCTLFGLARGLTVLLTSRAANPRQLRVLHARIDRAGPSIRVAVIAIEAAVGVVAFGRIWLESGGVLATVVALATFAAIVAGMAAQRSSWRPLDSRVAER